MKVRDVMTRSTVEVGPAESCQQAAKLMRDHDVGILLVTTEGHMIQGVITDRDLAVRCMALGGDPAAQEIASYMDGHPTTVDAEMELDRAVEVMRNTGLRRLPVTERGKKATGMLSLDDVALDVKHYLDSFLSVAGQYSRKAH